MGGDIFAIFDFMILLAGFYALYAAYVLRRDGKVTEAFLLNREMRPEACKDLQGYANYMGPKLNTLGAALIAYGVIALLNDFVVDISGLFFAMIVGFLIVLVWYGMAAKKALKMFF